MMMMANMVAGIVSMGMTVTVTVTVARHAATSHATSEYFLSENMTIQVELVLKLEQWCNYNECR